MAIGLAYLLPTDVSFSCWFFFFLRKLEDVGATALGYHAEGASQTFARIPYTGEQAAGAFLGFSLFSLWSMRGYLKEVVITAWRQDRSVMDDRTEPLSYRAALLGLAGGFVGLVAFAMLLGMAAHLAVLLFLLDNPRNNESFSKKRYLQWYKLLASHYRSRRHIIPRIIYSICWSF